MYLGKILEIASNSAFFGRPRHPYSEALIAASPIPNPRLGKRALILKGDVPSPINPPIGCRFEARCKYNKDQSCVKNTPKLVHVGNEHFVTCEKTKKRN